MTSLSCDVVFMLVLVMFSDEFAAPGSLSRSIGVDDMMQSDSLAPGAVRFSLVRRPETPFGGRSCLERPPARV